MASAKVTEIIDLESDEEPEVKKSIKKKRIIRCINFKCKSIGDMVPASSFACKFYNIDLAKQNKRYICKECLEVVLNHQDVSLHSYQLYFCKTCNNCSHYANIIIT